MNGEIFVTKTKTTITNFLGACTLSLPRKILGLTRRFAPLPPPPFQRSPPPAPHSFNGPKQPNRLDTMLKVSSHSLGVMGVIHFDTRGGIWTVHGLVVSPICRSGPNNAEEIALFLLGAVVARSIFEGGTVIELNVGLGDFMTMMREKMGWRGTQGGRLGLVSDERWEVRNSRHVARASSTNILNNSSSLPPPPPTVRHGIIHGVPKIRHPRPHNILRLRITR